MALDTRVEFGTAQQHPSEVDDFYRPEDEGRKLKRVILACGTTKKEGWIHVDREALDHVDLQYDLLTFPWPFNDNEVYEFECEHFIEHIPHDLGSKYSVDGLTVFMEEAYRCLMPYGTIRLVVPYYTSVRAWQDPTHCRVITERTFDYYNKEKSKLLGVEHYMGECNFEKLSQRLIVNPEFESKSEEAKAWAMRHYWNVIDDMEVVLRALK